MNVHYTESIRTASKHEGSVKQLKLEVEACLSPLYVRIYGSVVSLCVITFYGGFTIYSASIGSFH